MHLALVAWEALASEQDLALVAWEVLASEQHLALVAWEAPALEQHLALPLDLWAAENNIGNVFARATMPLFFYF
jgi:hypothetical protein